MDLIVLRKKFDTIFNYLCKNIKNILQGEMEDFETKIQYNEGLILAQKKTYDTISRKPYCHGKSHKYWVFDSREDYFLFQKIIRIFYIQFFFIINDNMSVLLESQTLQLMPKIKLAWSAAREQ